MEQAFRIDDRIVDSANARIVAPDGVHRISARTAGLLRALAECAGQVVERERLSALLWGEGAVHEEALSRCVSEARHALGDSGREHRCIETVPRHGYRLIGAVSALSAQDREQLRLPAPSPERGAPSLLARLLSAPRDQRVLRVAGAYAAAAWLLMQVADVTFERLGLPESGVTFVIVLAVLGFPLAVLLAWFYRPPAGVVRTPRSRLRMGVAALLLVGGIAAITFFIVDRLGRTDLSLASAHSIAVLPFVNLSSEPANDYLGDGLAEELASRLARFPDLEVASRTSAFTFKGSDADLATIARALGVRHVLEGSLRVQADTLRITVQLIDSTTGFHVWANTYERNVADIFAIEDSIAGGVAEALKLVLSPEQRASLEARTTPDHTAYDLYLKGLGELRSARSTATLDSAAALFREALAVDPAFTQAHAGLCRTDAARYLFDRDPVAVRSAEDACQQAARLDDDLLDVHVALGGLYLATGQPQRAERRYRRVIELDPEDIDGRIGLADALAGQGRVDAAAEAYEAAIAVRPRFWQSYERYGTFLLQHGRAADAADAYRRSLELLPANATVLSNLGAASFALGRFAEAADTFRRSVELEPTSAGYSNTGTMYYYDGRYADAIAMFERALALTPDDHMIWGNLADAHRFASPDAADAEAAYSRATELARATLSVNPADAVARAMLGYYLARRGQAAAAQVELARVVESGSADPNVRYYAALTLAETGRVEEAVVELAKAVAAGFPQQVIDVAPELASLRNDPRLAALAESANDVSR